MANNIRLDVLSQRWRTGLPAEYRWAAALNPLWQAAWEVVPLLVLYYLLDRGFRLVGQLGPASYERPWLLPELLRSLWRQPLVWLALTGLLVAGRRRLLTPWSEIENGRTWRLIVVLVALLAVWPLSTYDVNLYFGYTHLADRLLLLACAALLVWRPIFLLPLLFLFQVMLKQFDYPLGNYPWTEINLILRSLTVALAALMLYFVTGRKQFANFCFLLFCLIAAQYFRGGFHKLRIGWILHPHLNLLMHGAWAMGWARFLSAESWARLIQAVSAANVPLMLFALIVEAGAVLALWRRRWLPWFLFGWMTLHGGIFLYSGFFFWKWMGLELILLLTLFWRKQPVELPIFSRPYFLFSLVLISLGRLLFGAPNLSWFDTPLAYDYEFEVVGVSGAVYALPPSQLSYYNDGFVLGIFDQLTTAPQLTNAYAVTNDPQMAADLVAAHSVADILALEAQFPASTYDEARVAAMDDFLRGYLSHWNDPSAPTLILSQIPSPPHLWSFAEQTVFNEQEPAERVDIYQTVSFYYDGEIRPVRRTLIHSVAIP